jgi:multimeric flavodoxin WrbA
MKVLGFVGSPRKGSNTDLLVSAILYGAGASNHQIEKLNLYDFNISPCIDCRACQKGSNRCVLSDGMNSISQKIEEADIMIFGSPLYWYGPSAKMKLLLDRLRPFATSKKLAGKKGFLIIPSEEGAGGCDLAVEMFKRSFTYLGVEFVGNILPKAYEKAEIKNNSQVLNEAFNFGKGLH